MSLLFVDSFLLIRSPAYSYKNFNELFLREALGTDFFKAAIFLASKAYFTELKKKDFDYDLLNPQEKLTLWKYLNRMCFRSLPYGLFSSCATGAWGTGGLTFSAKETITIRPDFKVAADYIRSLNPINFDRLQYYTNNTMYRSNKQFRFINHDLQNKYTLVELKVGAGLIKLLKFIEGGKTKTQIADFLMAAYDDHQMVNRYIESLIDGQVILSSLTPNVTGTNYQERCAALLIDYPGFDGFRMKGLSCEITKDKLVLNQLNGYLDQLKDTENPCYTLYEKQINGGIDENVKSKLTALIHKLDKLCTGGHADYMKTFKADFIKKYDQQEVPLMTVLDPDTGIGYESLASVFEGEMAGYINDIRLAEKEVKTTKWGLAETMLFKKWKNLNRDTGDGVIRIKDDELNKLPEGTHHLPPGLSVLFRMIDDKIWIDQVAGVSGVALSARFGGEGTVTGAALKEICEHEMSVNHEFVFAEIAFSPNDRASNINQRAHFYPYEIPILTYSTLDVPFQIRLNDLMVSIRENKIYLRSVRLNKYIIPRLSSAYNYQLSTVAVFRFLCDLQFQGVKSNLCFSLPDLFPGMEHYPRVQLEDAVISPATWVLDEEQLKQLSAADDHFLETLRLPDQVSLHEGDNFLVFNLCDLAERSMFYKCLKNKKIARILEYTVPVQATLTNQSQEPFNFQMVASVKNKSKSYSLPKHSLTGLKKSGLKIKRSFLPGAEWLYLKLYAHHAVTDKILLDLILPVVKKYKKEHADFKWFFIRYQDPDHHLRLRFYTGNALASAALLTVLTDLLKGWHAGAKVAAAVVDTYQRELEKYSPVLINEVETFFYEDSEYILAALAYPGLNLSLKLSFAMISSLRIIHCFIEDHNKRSEFLNAVLHGFSSEFNREKGAVHQLDLKYRNFQKELIDHQSLTLLKHQRAGYSLQLHQLAEKIADWNETDRHNLLINLVHMHINRVFEHHPREYEYVIYHFMKKYQSYLYHTANAVF